MSTAANLKKVQELGSAIAAARARYKELAAQMDNWMRERAETRNIRLGKEDFVAFMMDTVDYNAKRAKREIAQAFKGSHPTGRSIDEVQNGVLRDYARVTPFMIDAGGFSVTVPVMCLFFRAQIEEGVKAIADEMESRGQFKDRTMTFEQRNQKITVLDQQISDAQDELTSIAQALIAQGLPKSEFHIERIIYE